MPRNLPLLVGTGTPSLADSIWLTRRAFMHGADAVVVVPPYYYKSLTTEGLTAYFRQLIENAVPDHGMLLLYHIPQVTGIPITFAVLEGLLEKEADRLVGVKDSSGDIDHARRLCVAFPGLRVFVGSDSLFLAGLEAGAAGCITAGANVLAPLATALYRAFQEGGDKAVSLQARLSAARVVLERHPPFPAALKSLLAFRYSSPEWRVRPPLAPLSQAEFGTLKQSLDELNLGDLLPWLAGGGRAGSSTS
jgi:4-hydroxy-tetrahydrodipicolinate synthase